MWNGCSQPNWKYQAKKTSSLHMSHFRLGSFLIGLNSNCIPSRWSAALEMTSGNNTWMTTLAPNLKRALCTQLNWKYQAKKTSSSLSISSSSSSSRRSSNQLVAVVIIVMVVMVIRIMITVILLIILIVIINTNNSSVIVTWFEGPHVQGGERWRHLRQAALTYTCCKLWCVKFIGLVCVL